MTDRLRWGILSTGHMAQTFAGDLALTGYDLRAVGSRSLKSAEVFADRNAIPRAYGTYEDLVADDDIDVVYVASPHAFHAAHARLALEADKHVLVEKAFTLDAAQAQELVDLADERGLFLMEAMWTRFLPHMVRIREIIAAGTLGRLVALTADHLQLLSDDPAHRLNALELGGGALLDLGVYPVSFASDILGTPVSVQSSARFRATGADCGVALVFGYADGATATVLCASDARGANTASIIGTEGRIDIAGTWYAPTEFVVSDRQSTAIDSFSSVVEGRGVHYEAAEVERRVAAGERQSDTMRLSETMDIMRTMDAVRAQIGLRYPGE